MLQFYLCHIALKTTGNSRSETAWPHSHYRTDSEFLTSVFRVQKNTEYR